MVLRNMKIDASGLPVGARLFSAIGSEDADILLSADAAAGAGTLSVAVATGLAAEDLIFVRSTSQFYASGSPVTYGEWARIKSIAGTTITLYGALNLSYLVSATAKITRISTLNDITLDTVTAVGGGAGGAHYFAEFDRCHNVNIINCHGDLFDDRNIQFRRCHTVLVHGGSFRRSRLAGLSYGIAAVNGSAHIKVIGVYGEDLRHLVTVGGNDGVCRDIKAQFNSCVAMREAGLDCHPGGDDIDYSHNTVSLAPGAGGAGIICQGANFTAIGNHVFNAPVFGIWHQMLSTVRGSSDISNNEVIGASGSTIGIEILTGVGAGGKIIGATMANNRVRGFATAFRIYANAQDIECVTVTGNKNTDPAGCTAQALIVRALAGKFVFKGTVSGNMLRTDVAAGRGLQLIGADAGSVLRIAVVANVVQGAGSGYGIEGVNTNYIYTDANIVSGFSSGGVNVAGANSSVGTNL